MKVIIAGSRYLPISTVSVKQAVAISGWRDKISEIVSGGARGVDGAGEWWAEYRRIPVKRFPADWARHGKAAGPIRNREMAEYADALIAVWDGKSKGTANMILEMHRLGKPVFVWRVNECVS